MMLSMTFLQVIRRNFEVNLFFLCCIAILGMTPLSLFCETIDESKQQEQKPTVCLNMIVKNESQVIKRCLKSVLPLIDTWVIVDTGSTDGTQQIIQEFMLEHQIPGELHERPWVNFGHNREEALALAKSKADYLLFIDADDVLRFSEQFKLPTLNLDVYLVKGIHKGLQFHLWTFVKASLDWHWHDPIHEYIQVKDAADGSLTGGILNKIQYVYIHDGARAKDSSTLTKDLQVLTKALEKDPENKRLTYYLAQTYANMHNLHQALVYYQKRIDLGGNAEEVFSAMMSKAKIQQEWNVKPEVLAATYQKALEFRPSRPEPYFYLSRLAHLKGDFQKGYDIAKSGVDLPESLDTLDLEYSTYEGIIFECAYCALELGKLKECRELCRILKNKPNLSSENQENLKNFNKVFEHKLRSKKALDVVNKLYGANS
ncbi:MAG: glycosyltransferase [Parachlamydiaceae bacterium]|nr:glycosyltransferase [Parachlamydiaceae bacterium]